MLTRTNQFQQNLGVNNYGGRDMRAGQMPQAQQSRSPLTSALQLYNSPEYQLGSNVGKIYNNAMARRNDGIYTVDGEKYKIDRGNFDGWQTSNGKPLTDRQMYEAVNKNGINPAELQAGDAQQRASMLNQGFKYSPQRTLQDIATRQAIDPKLASVANGSGPLAVSTPMGAQAANTIGATGGAAAGVPIAPMTAVVPETVGAAGGALAGGIGASTVGADLGALTAEASAAPMAAGGAGAGLAAATPWALGALGIYGLGKTFKWW